MSTLDTVFLGIAAIAIALFFVISSVLAVMGIVLVKKVKRVVEKAESAINTAEEAAEIFREASGKMAFVKLVRNIVKMMNRK